LTHAQFDHEDIRDEAKKLIELIDEDPPSLPR